MVDQPKRFIDDGPDWRWGLVMHYVDTNKQPPRRTSDRHVRRAFNYLRKRDKVLDVDSELWVRREYPDIFVAHDMFRNPCSEKWIIEAAILARQTSEQIADYIGCEKEVVDAYERYFFDVRKKLNSPGWISTRVLGPAFKNGAGPGDHDQLLKLAAWTSGWELVREFLDKRHMSTDSLAWLKTAFIHSLVRKGFNAVDTIKVNSFTSNELIGHTLRLAELEQQAKRDELAKEEQEASENELVKGVKSLLGALQTSILETKDVIGPERRVMAPKETKTDGKDG